MVYGGYNSNMQINADLPKAILITSSTALTSLVKTLSQQSVVAVDTESNSLYAYREQVCLIQFSITDTDFLVDPLSISDLTPLRPIFCNPQIEKVFHAAEYDLICLKRDFNFEFCNLFDTMIAARILGWEEVGLGSVLENEFGVRVDKKFQRANWGQRPIPSQMLIYAQLDTHYLITLRERLHRELTKTGLLALAEEDFHRACRVNGRNGENKNIDCWRISGSHDLTPKKATVLRELCRYRDQIARSMNRPLFKVISDVTLLAIAESCPSRLETLSELPGMTPHQIRRHGQALLTAVKTGLHSPPIFQVHTSRPDEQFLSRIEALRQWRKVTAQKMGVPSDVVLPRNLMGLLADKAPQTTEDLEQLLDDVPWRLKHFGAQILTLLQQHNSYKSN